MATLTNIAKRAASLLNTIKNRLSFLLQETGDYLLLEDGGRIVISGSVLTGTPKHSVSLTNVPKH